MSRRIFFPLALPALIAFGVLPAATFAQSSDAQSIADAARRSREQKKNASKASKVVTEDDIAPKNSKPADLAARADAAAAPDTQPADAVAAPPVPEAAAKSADDKELAELKAQLARAQKELDLDQRELALDQDTYLSNPGYQHDTAGKAKVDADKQHIGEKQQEVDRLKTRVAALQELKARSKSAAPAPTGNPPGPPQS